VRDADGNLVMREIKSFRFKEVKYVQGWARFGGFLIDMVFIMIFELMLGVAIGVILALTGNLEYLESGEFDIYSRLMTLLIIRPGYYLLFEATAQASPAKMILGRKVVNEYGEKPSFNQILARSYIRFIPFEIFSCLGELGWHDTWTKTFVLRKKDLKDLQLAIQVQELNKDLPENLDNSEALFFEEKN